MKCYCCGKEYELDPLTAVVSGWKPFDTPSGNTIVLCPNCSRVTSLDIMNAINRHRELCRREEIVADIPYEEVKIECIESFPS